MKDEMEKTRKDLSFGITPEMVEAGKEALFESDIILHDTYEADGDIEAAIISIFLAMNEFRS